jgi:hypothetical protein
MPPACGAPHVPRPSGFRNRCISSGTNFTRVMREDRLPCMAPLFLRRARDRRAGIRSPWTRTHAKETAMARYDRNRDERGRERGRDDYQSAGDYGRENYGRGQEAPQDDRYRYVSEGERGEYYGGANYERDWGSQGRRHPDSYEEREYSRGNTDRRDMYGRGDYGGEEYRRGEYGFGQEDDESRGGAPGRYGYTREEFARRERGPRYFDRDDGGRRRDPRGYGRGEERGEEWSRGENRGGAYRGGDHRGEPRTHHPRDRDVGFGDPRGRYRRQMSKECRALRPRCAAPRSRAPPT